MTLHPQARAYLDALGPPAAGVPTVEEIVAARASARSAALADAERVGLDHVVDLVVDDVGDEPGRGVPVRLYRPRVGAPVMLYVHGGGWTFHDLETHDSFCRHLAHVTGWAVLAVDYRLAPEHPWPAGLDDVQRVARWLRRHGREHRVDASWLPGLGDSSGANLVAALCVRDPALLDHQVLLYPPTDASAVLDPALSNAALTPEDMAWMWEAYAPGDLRDHPEVSVLRAPNLAEHPPAVVVTCEHDVLRDQGEAYAAALAAAGVHVTAHRALGTIHSFWRQPTVFDASRHLVVAVGAWLDAARAAARA